MKGSFRSQASKAVQNRVRARAERGGSSQLQYREKKIGPLVEKGCSRKENPHRRQICSVIRTGADERETERREEG